jgi:hypothetical protein
MKAYFTRIHVAALNSEGLSSTIMDSSSFGSTQKRTHWNGRIQFSQGRFAEIAFGFGLCTDSYQS